MSISAVIPSGLTNGKPAKVVATATAGTTFHTLSGTAGVIDEIWLYLTNTSATDVIASVEFGGVVSPDNIVKVTVPANDTIVAIPGERLSGSVTVGVFAPVANVLSMHGNVNRIS